MKSIDTARSAVLALAAGTLVLGGCASTAQVLRPVAAATSTSTPTDPRQLAQAATQKVIASLGRIPGAVRLSQPPAALRDVSVTSQSTQPDQPLEVGGWYSVPAPYKQALTEASAVLHAGASNGYGNVHEIKFVMLMQSLHYADARGDQGIRVDAYELTPTTSVLGIDVTDEYRPARTAAEDFPASGVIDVVIGSVTRGAKPEKSLLVTDQRTISRIAAILNALPTAPLFGPASCPVMPANPGKASSQHEIDLTFRATAEGPALVHADVYQPSPDEPTLSVCGFSGVAVDHAPGLDSTGHAVYAQVAALLGGPVGS